MATSLLTNCKLYVGGYNLSGQMNALGMDLTAEELDDTRFGNSTRVYVGGLRKLTYQHEGAWGSDGAAAPDDVLFDLMGDSDIPMTVCPTTGAVGEPATFFQSVEHTYTPLQGRVGEIARFSLGGATSGGHPPIRGVVLHAGTVTATGNGTAVNMGAVPSGKRLYAILHVTAASAGDTIDVIVQSDNASGMASPTTQITFAQVGAQVGAQYATPINGPITDTHFRTSHTVGGSSPSFTYFVAIGYF